MWYNPNFAVNQQMEAAIAKALLEKEGAATEPAAASLDIDEVESAPEAKAVAEEPVAEEKVEESAAEEEKASEEDEELKALEEELKKLEEEEKASE